MAEQKEHKTLIENICKVKISLGLTKKVGGNWKKAEVGYEAYTKDVNVEELENFLKKRANTKLEACFERIKPQRKGTVNIQFDIRAIQWNTKTGPKGLFEIADPNNEEFPKLYERVLQGNFVREGFLYWVLPDGKNVARKRIA